MYYRFSSNYTQSDVDIASRHSQFELGFKRLYYLQQSFRKNQQQVFK